MEKIYLVCAGKIIKNKKILEKGLKVKIKLEKGGSFITVEGRGEDEYLALLALEAIEMGFSIKQALFLKEEDLVFEKILIKNITRRKNLAQVRARLIGRQGKVLRVLEELSNCFIAVHENKVGIIGLPEDAIKARYAIERLIAGSEHSTIYGWLEARKAEERREF